MAARLEIVQAPKGVPLTPEDVALLADGSGNIPDDTATRLQAVIRCTDLELIQRTWRWIGTLSVVLRQLADDAGVELLADGLYVFRCFERLHSESGLRPGELLDPRLDVPYLELISMASAFADRGDDAERAELEQLIERLGVAWSEQIDVEEQVETPLRPDPAVPR